MNLSEANWLELREHINRLIEVDPSATDVMVTLQLKESNNEEKNFIKLGINLI